MRFITAYRFIETKYVNDTDDVKLIDGAIDGMVKSLNDPHSNYLSPKMYKTLMEQTEGSFAGIGVVMGMDNEQKNSYSRHHGKFSRTKSRSSRR